VFPTLEANDGKKWGSNQWVNQGKAIVQPITYSTPSIGTIVEDSVASCITKNSGAGGETQNPAFVIQPVTHSLRGEGFDASEDGTGRGTPLIPVAFDAYNQTHSDTTAALRCAAGGVYDNTVMQPVAFHPTQDPISSTDGTTHAMGCGSSGGAASVAVAQPLGFSGRGDGSDALEGITPTMRSLAQGADGHQSGSVGLAVAFDTYNQALNPHITHALRDGNSEGTPALLTAMQVRRLTPVECERLQGFPDNYTAIPWRKKPITECPDGPRYKALGNSWAVPVVRWIGKRIQERLNAP
jgi:DNA (cytosine-5)-methyltransferase 1